VVYLHYAHAIGMERLAMLMEEIFSLTLSEVRSSNMLARAREPLLAAARNDPHHGARQSGGVFR